MPIENKQDFLEHVELERMLLTEGVPVASLVAQSETIEFSQKPITTKSYCIPIVFSGHSNTRRKKLAALFFVVAWKALDMAVELALAREIGRLKQQTKHKVNSLKDGKGNMPELPAQVWKALSALYMQTVELRHSLVHRKSKVLEGRLIGSPGNAGQQPSSISHNQMVWFCELIQRTCDAIERGHMTSREERQCQYLLWELRDVHRLPTTEDVREASIFRVAYTLGQDRTVPVRAIKEHMTGAKPGWTGIDLELTDPVNGARYLGELDHITEDHVEIAVQNPPAWLKRQYLPSVDGGDDAEKAGSEAK